MGKIWKEYAPLFEQYAAVRLLFGQWMANYFPFPFKLRIDRFKKVLAEKYVHFQQPKQIDSNYYLG